MSFPFASLLTYFGLKRSRRYVEVVWRHRQPIEFRAHPEELGYPLLVSAPYVSSAHQLIPPTSTNLGRPLRCYYRRAELNGPLGRRDMPCSQAEHDPNRSSLAFYRCGRQTSLLNISTSDASGGNILDPTPNTGIRTTNAMMVSQLVLSCLPVSSSIEHPLGE